jgi:hypothetical protein
VKALAVMKNSPGKRTLPSRAVLLALATRRVALATIEPESHLTLPSAPAIVGSEPWQAYLLESVSEYGSLVAWVDSRTQESQRGYNSLSWFRIIDALHPTADDPYLEALKSGVTTVCRKRFGRGLARC